jgi:hypothetical protein
MADPQTPIDQDALDAKVAAILALDDSDTAIHAQWDTMTPDQKTDAVRRLVQIRDQKTAIEKAYLSQVVDSGAHRDIVAQIGQIAGAMTTEAKAMVDAAATLNAIATVLAYAAQAATLFAKLA